MGGRLLAVENCILRKEDQNEALKIDYKNSFELDLELGRTIGAKLRPTRRMTTK